MPTPNPLIIALDTTSTIKALHLVSKLKLTGAAFKVGFELFSSQGPKIVEKILNHDVRVFLDLKFHDIPNTVARAAEVATSMGVWMFNVHASGGSEMMKRAKEASLKTASQKRLSPPLVMGVTVLTSMNNLSELNIPLSVPDQVFSLATRAHEAGLDGVVASAEEASLIRKAIGDDFSIVTPGIRFSKVAGDDQKRSQTPKQAMEQGANYIVVGRPITQSNRPMKVVDEILSSLEIS